MGERDGRRPAVREAEVVIVGAGIAGAAAALEAARAGIDLLAIDQLPEFGGTAIVSGGGCCVAGSSSQATRGIEDTVELAVRDVIEAGAGEADEAWASFYLEHSARDVHDWLVDLGIEFVDVRHQEHSSVPRWHAPRGGGRAIMAALWAALVEAGLADRWRFSMTAEDLLRDRGRVTGVVARDARGGRHELRARAVVMATGGFAGSREMVLRHQPGLRKVARLLIGGGAGALGTGHDLLERHGAVLSLPGNLWSYATAIPDYRDGTGERGLVVRGLERGIWVNGAGRRFHDESLPGAGSATPALLAQDPATCWALVDRSMMLAVRIADPHFRGEDGTPAERIEELIAGSPFVHVGDSVPALAASAGLPADLLERTVREWDAVVRSGAAADPVTGRPLAGVASLSGPPYYALQLFPLVRKCLGGVTTDLRCRVVDAAGSPIPGLYGAGELCGLAGGHISGRRALEGMMIGASLFSGRVAGAWAAHAAGGPEPRHLTSDAATTSIAPA